jgi:putative ABC transport system permease protein
VLAELAQRTLALWVQAQFALNLPAANYSAWGMGVLVAVVMLTGFALPMLLNLRHVPAMRVISRQSAPPKLSAWLATLMGVGALAALGFLVVANVRLAAIVLGGLGAALALLALFAAGSIYSLGRLRTRMGVRLRLQTAGLVRRIGVNTMAISAIGLSASALILLLLLRTDLLNTWRQSLPADAPNRFVINLQDEQLTDFQAALATQHIAPPTLWPMLRGRLRTINGVTLDLARFKAPRQRALAEREFNLSIASELPKANRLVDENGVSAPGAMFAPNVPSLSLELEIARLLGVKRGDVLEFDVGGVATRATVHSLREVNWESLQPNFFALLNQAAWKNSPASWMTAMRIDARSQSLDTLVAQFSNISVIDLDLIEAQVRRISAQASRAIELVFWFTFAAGLLVLLAAIQTTQAQRQRDCAIMRALGAQNAQLLSFDRLEFAWIGLIAGVIGAASASGMTALLMREIFQMRYTTNAALLSVCVLATMALVLAVGLFGTRHARQNSPIESLRAAE